MRRSLRSLLQRVQRAGLEPHLVWGAQRSVEAEGVVLPEETPFQLADPLHLGERGHRIVAAEIIVGLTRASWLAEKEPPTNKTRE